MKFFASHPASQILTCVLVLLTLAACSVPAAPAEPTLSATSTIAAPTFTPRPTLASTPGKPSACIETRGTLVDSVLPAKMLKYPLEVTVYLPPCYGSDAARTYPTLYMLHGMADNKDQWVKLGMTEAADRLIAEGTIQPMLIVMPYEINWQLSPEESGFGTAITDLLIPWVEKTYHACAERDCRAIGGLSRGGNWAVKIGFEHWQLFTAVGAHSTPLFIGGILNLTSSIRQMPSVSDAPAVYVDAGNKDENLGAVQEFEKILSDLHVAHEYHLGMGAHDAVYWSAHVGEYLLWYASQLKK